MMAGAEGRGIKRDELAAFATYSMAAFMSQSDFNVHMSVFDEIYEHDKSGGSLPTEPAILWEHICGNDLHSHDSEGRASAAKTESELELDFCFAPIDGKHALSAGQTGGTVSALCFAAHDPAKGSFLPPRLRIKPQKQGGKRSGNISDADRSPPWLVVCLGERFVHRHGGIEKLQELVRVVASQYKDRPVTALLRALFTGPQSEPQRTTMLPIPLAGTMAVLAEPQASRTWHLSLLPDCKKRLFVGSSIAVALAALYPQKGFDCSVSVARHIHAVHASVAAKAMGGAILAIPVYGEGKADGFIVENDQVITHNDFVTTDDCALIVSGISEHVVLQPVRFRGLTPKGEEIVKVHSLILSARTNSIRSLEHRLVLGKNSGTRFVSYDLQKTRTRLKSDKVSLRNPIPHAKVDFAMKWRAEYLRMFGKAERTSKVKLKE
ncbi:MAG: fructose-bisphosphatase class II [Phycisphaerales bacterium]|nr:fructose-bisphosphatase class II [Phycisphaerales bacterium]